MRKLFYTATVAIKKVADSFFSDGHIISHIRKASRSLTLSRVTPVLKIEAASPHIRLRQPPSFQRATPE